MNKAVRLHRKNAIDVSRNNQSGKGFSSTPKNQAAKKLSSRSAAEYKIKEQQALTLINQGKLNEAELIYKELVAAGSGSHIAHGNLGALLKMKGEVQKAVECFKKAIKLKPDYPEAHNNLGNTLKEQGDLAAAIASYNTALSLNPNHPKIHNNLGVALKEQGDLIAAITSYNTALKLKWNYPEAHNNLGNALKDQGELTAAITSYNTALSLDPNYPEAHNNLGAALKEQGDLAAAINSYNTALKLNLESSDTHNNLGVALKEQGHLTAAINSYKTALKFKPSHPYAHFNLGNALQERGDLTAAIASYKTALQFKPNYAEAYNNLGNILHGRGDLAAALTLYKTALQFKPNFPDAYNSLGNAFQDRGEFDTALSNYKKALEIDPKYSNAFYGIGRIQAIKGDLKESKLSFHRAIELNQRNTAVLYELSKNIESHEESKKLSARCGEIIRAGLNKQEESMLEFALANSLHKSKNYAKAAHHLANANKLKLSFYPSNLNELILRTRQITALASSFEFGNLNDGKGRIFIIGAPRCGSTLLESVLSTNSNICGLGEAEALKQAFEEIIKKIRANDTTSSLPNEYTKKIKHTLAHHTHSIDKNLYNFRFTEAIAKAMPAAKIIHCRRHPLDNILSMLRSNLKAGNNYTSDPLDSAKFLIHQEETMDRYKREYEDRIFTFDYDAFTRNPETILRPLIDWLELEWTETYLHPEKGNRVINTASVIQARQPINSKSVGGWKNYRELLKPAEDVLLERKIFNL